MFGGLYHLHSQLCQTGRSQNGPVALGMSQMRLCGKTSEGDKTFEGVNNAQQHVDALESNFNRKGDKNNNRSKSDPTAKSIIR